VKKQPIPFGKYFLLDRINIGGMAEVYKAKTLGVEGFEKVVAIKRILPNIAEDAEFITMFIDEAKISVQLTHANIAQIYDLGKINDSYFIAMEYVSGKDLRSIFDRARRKGEPVPIPMACFIISKLCEGLDFAHRKKDAAGRDLGIVHRDISPQNCLISFEGEVKLIDFGIAKAANKASKTQAGILKGKFGYMSPEQVRGLPLDRRSDVFAVGVCLYELLTGERLFVGESDFSTLEKVRNVDILPPTTYNRRIPEPLEKIVLKALAKDVEDRYQWANELQDDLQKFLIVSDSIFSRKDLSAYMKATFAEDLEREKMKLKEAAEFKLPAAAASPPKPPPSRSGGYPPPLPEIGDSHDTQPKESPNRSDIGGRPGPTLFTGDDDEPEPRTAPGMPPLPSPAKSQSGGLRRDGSPGGRNLPTEPPPRNGARSPSGRMNPGNNSGPLARPIVERNRSQSMRPPPPSMQLEEMERTDTANRPGPAGMPLWAKIAAVIAAVVMGGIIAWVLWKQRAPAMPELTLICDSGPCEFFVDEAKIGDGDVFKKAVRQGEHVVKVTKDGYKPFEETVKVGAAEPKPVYARMEKIQVDATALLVVTTNPLDAEVIVDNKTVREKGSREAVMLDVKADAEHVIRVKAAGYREFTKNITPAAGAKTPVAAELVKAISGVKITTVPDKADVYLDGKKRGLTPLTIEGLDPNLQYKLLLKKKCFKDYAGTVIFDSDSMKEVNPKLEPRSAPGCPPVE
jgi:serine/threonine protein kinase